MSDARSVQVSGGGHGPARRYERTRQRGRAAARHAQAFLMCRPLEWPRVAPHGKNTSYLEVLPMAVRKGSYSLDERAAEYLDRRAKLTKRSASAVLSDLVAEAARQDARDRALNELGEGVEIPER